MTIPSEMNALLLVGDGYERKPTQSALEAMEPYVQPGRIGGGLTWGAALARF